MNGRKISKSDRIISALTYITGGMAGFIWLICCAIFKYPVSEFLLFNIYQSICLALFISFAHILFGLVYNLLIMVPFINILVNSLRIAVYSPVLYNLSIIGIIIFALFAYLVIMSLFGKIGYVPWITKIILYQMDNFKNGGK